MSLQSKAVMEAFWNCNQKDRKYWHRDGVYATLLELVNQLKYVGITEENILKIAEDLKNK